MSRFQSLPPRTVALLIALGAFALLGAACSGDDSEVPAAPKDDAVLVLGQQVWAANCTTCHSNDGSGSSGPKLAGNVVDHYPDVQDQIDVVANGKGMMPAFGSKLSDEEIEAVVAYTRDVL